MGAKKKKAVKRQGRRLVKDAPARKPVKKRKRPTTPPKNNGKHPGGRPSKYTPEIVQEARDYLEHYQRHGDVIPSVVGLALVLDVRRDTIHEWVKEKPEFSDIVEKILSKQEQSLIGNGLKGKFNASITKLVLGKHGYHDKIDAEHTGKDGGPLEHRLSKALTPEELARGYGEFAKS